MVWIHGGAFMAGGTGIELFDCTNLIKENPGVIFVTVAYRLGALGFLHLSHLPDGKDYPDAQNLGLLVITVHILIDAILLYHEHLATHPQKLE